MLENFFLYKVSVLIDSDLRLFFSIFNMEICSSFDAIYFQVTVIAGPKAVWMCYLGYIVMSPYLYMCGDWACGPCGHPVRELPAHVNHPFLWMVSVAQRLAHWTGCLLGDRYHRVVGSSPTKLGRFLDRRLVVSLRRYHTGAQCGPPSPVDV